MLLSNKARSLLLHSMAPSFSHFSCQFCAYIKRQLVRTSAHLSPSQCFSAHLSDSHSPLPALSMIYLGSLLFWRVRYKKLILKAFLKFSHISCHVNCFIKMAFCRCVWSKFDSESPLVWSFKK